MRNQIANRKGRKELRHFGITGCVSPASMGGLHFCNIGKGPRVNSQCPWLQPCAHGAAVTASVVPVLGESLLSRPRFTCEEDIRRLGFMWHAWVSHCRVQDITLG